MANQNPLTLTRQQLYDLVWSKPVRDVANDFGMSDVALAKRCRAVGVPIPPRGYWSKVAAGQKPRKTPLPKHRSGRYTDATRESPPNEPTVTFAPRPTPAPTEPTTPISPAEAALRARIDALDLAPSADRIAAHPAVLRTAVHMKHLKSRDLPWPRGTRSGPIIEVRNVSEAQQERALKVLDALLRGAESLGWSFESPPRTEPDSRRAAGNPPTRPTTVVGQLIVDGEPLQLRIDERQRQTDHVATEQEKADKKRGRYVWMPRFDYAPSGELRLHVTEPGHSYTEKVWKDTRAHPLEVQLRKIIHGLLNLALERKRQRDEQRLRQIDARELERQQAIIRQRRAANVKLTEDLERQSGAWHRARFLRAYLRAAKRALGDQSFTVDLQDQPTDFIRWAEHYVNQLDPLHPEPRDPGFEHERTFQYGADEKRFAEELQRLLGHAWEHAPKAR